MEIILRFVLYFFSANTQHLCQFHQIKCRSGIHFSHDVPAVNFYRNLSKTHLGRDLLV
jgi:hypothetical protein